MSPEEVATVDHLCSQLYSGVSNVERRSVEEQLLFLANPSSLDRSLQLLEQSASMPTLFMVCSSLRRMTGPNGGQLDASQLGAIANQVVQLLITKGPSLDWQVSKAFATLLAQMVKLGWTANPTLQQFPGKLLSSLMGSQPALALLVCTEIVAEASHRATQRSLEDHKAVLAAIRDTFLPDVFRAAVECMAGTRHAPDMHLWAQALRCIETSLAYDFTCAMPDETLDGADTVCPPESWQPMLQPPALTMLLWEVYGLTINSPQALGVLRCLSLAVSLPRAFFQSTEARIIWLSTQLQCTTHVMHDCHGLDAPETHVEFTHGLARLKANASLSQMVTCPQYSQWMSECVTFTQASFNRWDVDHSHLLAFWTSITVSISMLPDGPTSAALKEMVPRIAVAFVESRMRHAQWIVENSHEDNPLGESAEQCTVQLQTLSKLITPFYAQVGQTFVGHLQSAICDLNQASTVTPRQLHVAECKLTWMVYIIGVIIAGHCGDFGEECELYDAQLGIAMLQLLQAVQQRFSVPGAADDEHLHNLERSLLFWMRELRRIYIAEEEMLQHKVLLKMKNLMGLEDVTGVVQLLVNKIMFNMQHWGNDGTIISETLLFLHELTQHPLLAAEVQKVELIQMLLQRRGQCPLHFLTNRNLLKARRRLFHTLGKLLFRTNPTPESFAAFLEPQDCILNHVMQTDRSHWMESTLCDAVLGLASDLAGVCEACEDEKAYGLLLQWVTPQRFMALVQYFDALPLGHEAGSRLLKLFIELLHDRRARIPHNNPVITYYSQQCLAVACSVRPPPTAEMTDPWKFVCRPKYLSLALANRIVSGRYVDLNEIQGPLSSTVQLLSSIPKDDILAYPKLSRTYFNLLADLFERQCSVLQHIDSPSFMQLCDALMIAVQHSHINRRMTNRALAAIDRLASHPEQYAHHLQHRDVLSVIGPMVFSLCLLDSRWNSSPLLPLILQQKETFLRHLEAVSGRITQEEQRNKFNAAAMQFLQGVPSSLEASAREGFTKKLVAFRRVAGTR